MGIKRIAGTAAAIAATLAVSVPGAGLADGSRTAPRILPQVTHVAWVVPDLDRALADAAAQTGTAGANVVFRRVLTVEQGRYKGKPANFSADFALVEMGNTQFEFIQPLTGVSPYSDALKGHRGGVLHHVAFTVAGLDRQIETARRANPAARVVLDAHLKGLNARYVYMSGVLPDTLVEFIPAR